MAVFCWFLDFDLELRKAWYAKHTKGRAKARPYISFRCALSALAIYWDGALRLDFREM
jgi:hypothetical protein